MSDTPSAAAAPGPMLAGVIARWLGSFLILAAIAAFLTGLPGTGLMIAGGGVLLVVGLAFSVADRKARPPEAAPPPPSPLLAMLTLVMAIAAFLVGAVRTMASAPSSSSDFLIEGIGLAAALLLFVLAIFAFGIPRIRLPVAFLSIATVAALFLFSLALS